MLDLLRYFPPALQAGLLLYGLACFLWLQPLVEHRWAEKILLPQCEAQVATRLTATRERAARERNKRQKIIDLSRRLMGDFQSLPGMREANDLIDELATADLPDLGPDAGIDSTTPCGCAVNAAFDEVRWQMLGHVMSARTYDPPSLSRLPQAVDDIAVSGKCGGR